MAADQDREPARVARHLERGVIGIGLLGGAPSDKNSFLVVVELRRLHKCDAWIAQVPEQTCQVVASGNVIGIEHDHNLILSEPELVQPGIDVAGLCLRLKRSSCRVVLRASVACEVAGASASAK